MVEKNPNYSDANGARDSGMDGSQALSEQGLVRDVFLNTSLYSDERLSELLGYFDGSVVNSIAEAASFSESNGRRVIGTGELLVGLLNSREDSFEANPSELLRSNNLDVEKIKLQIAEGAHEVRDGDAGDMRLNVASKRLIEAVVMGASRHDRFEIKSIDLLLGLLQLDGVGHQVLRDAAGNAGRFENLREQLSKYSRLSIDTSTDPIFPDNTNRTFPVRPLSVTRRPA